MGTTDYRHPAIEIMQENGSNISEFKYVGYEILKGKTIVKRTSGNLYRK